MLIPEAILVLRRPDTNIAHLVWLFAHLLLLLTYYHCSPTDVAHLVRLFASHSIVQDTDQSCFAYTLGHSCAKTP
jgi:hypothetical protein